MNDVDFKQWLTSFLKRPILVEQEAQIVAAIIDGRLNIQSAKKLYKLVLEQNLKSHENFMAMSHEEIMKLAQ